MRKIIFITIISSIILKSSTCSKNNNFEIVEGMWGIDTVSFKHMDVSQCLNLNIINLEKNSKCDFPMIWDDCEEIFSYDRTGSWLIIQKEKEPLKLKINSNNFFNGNHKIVFFKDETNHLLKMRLESDSLYVICRKGLLNFNENKESIEKLVKLSN